MANQLTQKRVAKATYSFAVDGGAVSTIQPQTSDIIPSGAIITNVIFDSKTATTSGGAATVAITGGGLTLVAAQTIANNLLDGTLVSIMKAAGNTGSTSTAPYIVSKTTSAAPIKVVVAVAALTAGIFDVYVEYDYAD